MNNFIKRILTAALTVLLFAGVGALAACGDRTQDAVDYTVTVSCEETLPASLTVQLLKDGSPATDKKPLSDGKAVFSLTPADYTVSLDGAEGYTYAPATLSATVFSAAVVLRKESVSPVPFPVTSFSAPYVGHWVSLRQSGNAPLFRIDIESDALYVNDEPLSAYTLSPSETSLRFASGEEEYVLSEHTRLSGALALAHDGEELLLVPREGLLRVTLPAALLGTWSNGTETFTFAGNTFTFRGADGYVVSYDEETGELLAIAGEDLYALLLHAETQTLTVEGVSSEFTKSGLGTADDPFVLSSLAGKRSVTLNAAKADSDIWESTYYYINVYFTYTPEAEETYTLLVTDQELNLMIQTLADFNDEENGGSLLYWYAGSIERDYQTFTLEEGTPYVITVGYNTGDLRSETLPAPYEMTFAIMEGILDAPNEVQIPEPYQGTWYLLPDRQISITFSATKLVWKGFFVLVEAADETSLTASVDGEEYVFTVDGTALSAKAGGKSMAFSLVPAELPEIPSIFGGLWINQADPTDLLYIRSARSGQSAFFWLKREANVIALETGGLILLSGEEIWRLRFDLSELVVTSPSGEAARFGKAEGLQRFSAPYVGSFASADKEYTLTVTPSSFKLNGVELAGDVWTVRGTITVFLNGELYQISDENGLVLTVLSTGERVLLA